MLKCVTYDMTINPSAIKHPKAGMSCFAAQNSSNNKRAGHLYGTIIYVNPTSSPENNNYGEVITSVTVR